MEGQAQDFLVIAVYEGLEGFAAARLSLPNQSLSGDATGVATFVDRLHFWPGCLPFEC